MTLDEFMKQHALSNGEAARHIGVTREMVRRYRAGDAMPTENIRRRIHIWTQGAVTDWPPVRPRTK